MTATATQPEVFPWSELIFDLGALAEFPVAPRVPLTDTEQQQVLRLSGLMVERARAKEVELPAFPALAARVLNIADEKEPDLRKLVDVIKDDAMISAQVLRMSNSAFYSRGIEVTTVHAAAVRVGIRAVASVAIAAATRALLNAQEREYHDSFRSQWRALAKYGPSCAAAARWLSVGLRRGDPEEAFLGGLLHDLGKIVGLRLAGQMVQEGDLSPDVSAAVLELVLEETHVFLGADLALTWQLPGSVSYLCEKHHQPWPEAVKANDVLHVVRLASGLYESRTNPHARASLEEELYWSALSLELAREPLERIAAELKRLGSELR